MPNFFEQYDPTKPGGAENILTGGSVAPWNAGKGAFKNNAKYDPYNPDPANFQDPNLAGALAGYGQGIQNAQGRQGPQANPYWQQGNMNLANQLASLGSGQGPSIAGAQFDLGHQSGLASNAAMAASGSSAGNPALASRMLAQTQAGANQAAAGQRGMIALQEQAQARGQLANVLAQGQQGDLGQGSLDLQNQQQIDGMTQFYESLGYSREEANRQAQIEMERIKAGAYGTSQGYQYGRDVANQQADQAIFSGIVGAGGGLAQAYMSDERQKKNITPADKVIEEFLSELNASSYDYKDPSMPGAAPGRQVGVMAQEMAASPMGREAVVNTPNGMGIDVRKGLGAALAGLAPVNKKVEEIQPYASTDMSPYAAAKYPNDEARARGLRDDLAQQRRDEIPREQVPGDVPPASAQSSGRRVLDRIMQILGTGQGGARSGGTAVSGSTS